MEEEIFAERVSRILKMKTERGGRVKTMKLNFTGRRIDGDGGGEEGRQDVRSGCFQTRDINDFAV